MNDVPSWWEAVLLTLAIFRVYRLIAEDTILDRPRRWLLRLGDWKEDSGSDPPENYRFEWGIFITCPWCLGFHISWITWLLWLAFPHATVLIATPFAFSAVVALIAKNWDREEE